MTEEITVTRPTVDGTIEKLVNIYREIALLTEDAGSVVADAKEAGLDSSTIVKVAKAIALDKIDKLKEQTDKLQEMIDEFA